VTLTLDAAGLNTPDAITIFEQIPSVFSLGASAPPPTGVTHEAVDGEIAYAVARWEFHGSEVRDRTITLQIKAPEFATPDCDSTNAKADGFRGWVIGRGTRVIIQGFNCMDVKDIRPPSLDPVEVHDPASLPNYLPVIHR
jgi:hypothetical protein